MTVPEPLPPDETETPEPASAPVICEAWGRLHGLACGMREDWGRVEWQGLIIACRDSGLPFKDVYVEVMRLAWDLGTSSADALAEVRNLGRKLAQRPPQRGSLDPGLSAALRSGNYAAAWAATHEGPVPARLTGPQPRLTEDNDPRHGAGA